MSSGDPSFVQRKVPARGSRFLTDAGMPDEDATSGVRGSLSAAALRSASGFLVEDIVRSLIQDPRSDSRSGIGLPCLCGHRYSRAYIKLRQSELADASASRRDRRGSPYIYDHRVIKSVIPAEFIRLLFLDAMETAATSGPIIETVVAPDDPLVNKFPGDWVPRASNTIRPPPSGTGRLNAINGYTEYSRSDTSWYNASNFDPDSYWLPQMDYGVTRFANLPARTRIPRSARMPNIGYLQYVRTGIIPDNEAVPYQSQHGTPFRLLSYAPSTLQGAYPDWALLDLLYIPSTLIPYGSPYNSRPRAHEQQRFDKPRILWDLWRGHRWAHQSQRSSYLHDECERPANQRFQNASTSGCLKRGISRWDE